ncbi:Uncharacterized protein OS=Sorangium cellulosum (strain So ce56) GN=sce5710 PE=4 SV=1 [Gemmata massiliana]|uniref:SMI1/KNR4 family protein n=2 Tax=Gemmata massiliana TaxID=1210884 RepID=A0A6P2D0B4_9BACT|nr:Uncharacterized protein OS=Sorangium cellulosum (strain So ce56) GN=sce5710 PE=4 SV=1 [Gemmata massiliana]
MRANEWDQKTYRFLLGLIMESPRRSERKMRLLAVACSRQWADVWPTARLGALIDAAEQVADGTISDEEVVRLTMEASRLNQEFRAYESDDLGAVSVRSAGRTLSAHGRWAALAQDVTLPDRFDARSGSYQLAAALFARCIFRNPFRPVTFSPFWRSSTAVALASQMYESRDFGAMPILADALQDAGCDSADVLGHCRSPGPHVRGCWVVDLVLAKE